MYAMVMFVLSALSSPTGLPRSALNQGEDKDAIQRVLRAYLDVTDKKDQAAIARAFHPSAKLMSAGQNELREMSQSEWWQRISRIPGPVKRKSAVSFIDVTGLAAVARIDFERSSDYLALLKIGGVWKIVNKTLSTSLP
jgi:hypothetical protein